MDLHNDRAEAEDRKLSHFAFIRIALPRAEWQPYIARPPFSRQSRRAVA
jgi:hypothetical protein